MSRFGWTRRDFLKKTGAWAGAGLLQPVLSLIGEGKTIAAAYPDEVLSIEKYTKGKVKPGMIISKDNADLVRDLSPEGLYEELKLGREIRIAETTLEPSKFLPRRWIEATLRNKGQAVLDKNGQLWNNDGQPWIGGDPFPEPKSALEAMWNQIFNYNKHDDYINPNIQLNVDREGKVLRRSDGFFVEIHTVGRIFVPPTHLPEYKDELFRNVVTKLSPFDVYGLSIGSTIYYDASKLPDTFGYIPSLRRVRRLPSNQRFEPTAPYDAAYLSEFNIHNDPLLMWSWKLAGRKPMLAPAPTNNGSFLGAKKGEFNWPIVEEKFPRSTWELRPEVLAVEGVPRIAGAPYSKRVLYVDAILNRAATGDHYDLQGKIWKWTCFSFGPVRLVDGTEYVSVQAFVFADVQKDYRSNFWNPSEIGGMKLQFNKGLTIDDWISPRAMMQRSRR